MSKKKDQLLGMDHGTAMHRLRKAVMFDMANRLDLLWCFRCGGEIETIAELSIEHKDSWQLASDPVAAFFSLGNIGFSHHSCNCGAAHRPNKRFASSKEKDAFHNARGRRHKKNPSG